MSTKDLASENGGQTHITRRTFLRAGGLTMFGSVLAACGGGTPAVPSGGAGAAPTVAGAPVVLKGATVKFLGAPWSFLPALDGVIEAFANDWATQNGVTVTFERDAQLLPKIQTAIETKGGANIIQYSSPPAIFSKALADVSDIAESIGSEGGGYLPAGPYQMVFDGKWLGVPIGQHNWFINYRQDWLKEEGLDTFPDTWEEALAVGKKLKAKGRPFGMTLSDQAGGDGNAVPRLMLWAFGGKEFNPDGSLALDSPETLAALEFCIQLHNEAGDPGEVGYDDGANNAAFLASKISMTANVNTIYLPALEKNPEVAAGMNHALPPQGPGGRFGYGQLPWWGILNHTQGADLDAAKDLMRQFLSIKNFSTFYKAGQGYILPLLPNYESEPIWPADPKLAIAKDMFKLARPAGYSLPNQTKLAALMQDKIIIGKLFSQALSTGNARAALDGVMKDIADLKLLA
ncbi:MAG: extracellular solute-binding protein [Roseiflexaceae bacterium]|nr:extracellular solute-binding protein [Roseiflexaceae bacterium]